MANTDIQNVLDLLKKNAVTLATSTIKDFGKEAKKDAEEMVDYLKAKLEKWTKQLLDKQITPDDFADLVKGQEELIQMDALKKVGLAQIKVDELKGRLLKLVIDTVIGLI